MNLSGKTVLVTGAGGFVGSHLTEQLVQLGATTRAMVHYNALGNAGWLEDSEYRDQIELWPSDICDPDCVRTAMEGADIVFHLAALIAIPYSYRAPESYVRTNVFGTLNVLQAARQLQTPRIVHTSTSEVYGTARRVPIDEEHPLQGQSPYSASKISADKMAEAFHLSFNVPVTTVRPFNTFGPRQSTRAIIPTLISQCLAGDVVSIGNAAPTRDLNYVSNTVDGFLKAALCDEAVGDTFNLGTGREIAIGKLAERIAELVGKPVRIQSQPERLRPEKSEVMRLVADATHAANVLGWYPAVDLENGLLMTIDWLRENLCRYQPHAYAV